MPEMHLKMPEFTYSACGTFTKNKDRIEKFKETADSTSVIWGLLPQMGSGFFKILTT